MVVQCASRGFTWMKYWSTGGRGAWNLAYLQNLVSPRLDHVEEATNFESLTTQTPLSYFIHEYELCFTYSDLMTQLVALKQLILRNHAWSTQEFFNARSQEQGALEEFARSLWIWINLWSSRNPDELLLSLQPTRMNSCERKRTQMNALLSLPNSLSARANACPRSP